MHYNVTETTNIPGSPTDFEKVNAKFACLCQLMMTVCADLFRDVLNYYIQPAELKTELRGICRYLKSILNFEQLEFLEHYLWLSDNSDEGDALPLVTRDLSLLYILIRFMSSIPPPQNGWGNRPESNDKSLAGYLERIRILGKTILDHSEETKDIREIVSKDILTKLRKNIGEIQKMVFKKDSYAQAVDKLFSLDIELSERYIHAFKKSTSKNFYERYFLYIEILMLYLTILSYNQYS